MSVFMAACEDCIAGSPDDASGVKSFLTAAERGRWMHKHELETGHCRWWTNDRAHEGVAGDR